MVSEYCGELMIELIVFACPLSSLFVSEVWACECFGFAFGTFGGFGFGGVL